MARFFTITLLFIVFFADPALANSGEQGFRNAGNGNGRAMLVDKGLGDDQNKEELHGFVHNRNDNGETINVEVEGGIYPAGRPNEFQSINPRDIPSL